jgi:hypothetical protein
MKHHYILYISLTLWVVHIEGLQPLWTYLQQITWSRTCKRSINILFSIYIWSTSVTFVENQSLVICYISFRTNNFPYFISRIFQILHIEQSVQTDVWRYLPRITQTNNQIVNHSVYIVYFTSYIHMNVHQTNMTYWNKRRVTHSWLTLEITFM